MTGSYKLNSDQTVAVSLEVPWLSMATCPKGAKVLLLGGGGAAALGTWDGKNTFWKGWFPLPYVPATGIGSEDQKFSGRAFPHPEHLAYIAKECGVGGKFGPKWIKFLKRIWNHEV